MSVLPTPGAGAGGAGGIVAGAAGVRLGPTETITFEGRHRVVGPGQRVQASRNLRSLAIGHASGSGRGSVAARHRTGIAASPVAHTTIAPTIAPRVSLSPTWVVAAQTASSYESR